ncbi:hypothetical protein ABVK25_007564 [Lepraria finkii]|uniref:Uncharacterized protein n=1 Tax=Lepraria finkii TaxID=1340010 RepID=A0ABR4B2I6_9LECA
MKRPRADLDPHPSSPTTKRSRKAAQSTSNLEGQTLASQTSTDSSTSTLLGFPPVSPSPQNIPSELDYSISDTSSSTSSDSSNLDDSSDSLSESSGPDYRNQHLIGAEIAEATSAYANATDSDSDSDPSSLSSTSASISDDISESSSPGSDSALDASSPSSPSSASTSSLIRLLILPLLQLPA